MTQEFQVTKLSSKGQVVLPQAIREQLHLTEGEKFIVLGERDTVILKKIEVPPLERAKRLVKESRTYARKVRLAPSEVRKTTRRVRSQA